MNRISFNCSNFVAEQYGYGPTSEWDACVDAVNAYYSPPETFEPRFEQMARAVKALGFDLTDLWTAGQLNWRWATPEQVAAARRVLDRHGIAVASLGGDFGETRQEFVAACRMAVGVNTKLLAGICDLLHSDRAFVVEQLEAHDLYLAIENHPEKTPQEMLAQIGGGAGGRIGTTIDTGWWATQNYDVPRAIQALRGHILHVHLKDVRAGSEHQNVGYGQGIVPLEASVRALSSIGYGGAISLEDHRFDLNPMPEIARSYELLRGWLGAK